MSVSKYFVRDNMKKAEIDSYLAGELKKAGYSKVEMTKTPLGTRVVIYAAKPGMVIGRRGQSIRDLTQVFEQTFGMENPQVSVAAIEVPRPGSDGCWFSNRLRLAARHPLQESRLLGTSKSDGRRSARS